MFVVVFLYISLFVRMVPEGWAILGVAYDFSELVLTFCVGLIAIFGEWGGGGK